ncbi:MAG: kynureninase [Chloroflexota bacterium]
MDRRSRESSEYAAGLDRADPLAAFRARFYVPAGKIYLDGNSLGLASIDAERSVLAARESWKTQGIEAWTDGRSGDSAWFDLAERLGAIEAPLVGALPHEVVVTGGTTVNLHALVATFYEGPGRIVTDDRNFPSDVYALRSQAALRSGSLTVVTSGDEPEEALIDALDGAALLLVSSIDYRTGRIYDLARLAAAARSRGVAFGVDASHSVGCVPHQLHEWGIDFAFWCGYKYLNGGPGAVAGLFVHERHHGRRSALSGWWGSDKRRQFGMALEFDPASGAGAWQIGTPPILSLAALEGALQINSEAGIDCIREKSLGQTGYLMDLVEALLSTHGFTVATPREPQRRGGHVALTHDDAAGIARALRRRGIVPDFRPPNIVRLAPSALYTTYMELWETVGALAALVEASEQLDGGANGRVT